MTAAQLDDDPAEELVIGFGELFMLDDGDEVGKKFELITPTYSGTPPTFNADCIDVAAGDLVIGPATSPTRSW